MKPRHFQSVFSVVVLSTVLLAKLGTAVAATASPASEGTEAVSAPPSSARVPFDLDHYLRCSTLALASTALANLQRHLDSTVEPNAFLNGAFGQRLSPAQRQLVTDLAIQIQQRQELDSGLPFQELQQFAAGVCYAQPQGAKHE